MPRTLKRPLCTHANCGCSAHPDLCCANAMPSPGGLHPDHGINPDWKPKPRRQPKNGATPT